eukprot:2267362-Amphidinium_carterae.1
MMGYNLIIPPSATSEDLVPERASEPAAGSSFTHPARLASEGKRTNKMRAKGTPQEPPGYASAADDGQASQQHSTAAG